MGGFAGDGGLGGLGGNAGVSGGGASGGCELELASCQYVYVVNPDTTSFTDRDSARSEAGHYCVNGGSSVWQRDVLCSYGERCDIFAAGGPACVSCGDIGRRRYVRTVNGVLAHDCEGCTCGGWY